LATGFSARNSIKFVIRL